MQTANAALQSIPFGNLIGAPLEACVNAQAQAARTTYEYISEVGFDVKSEYEWEARTVSFTFMMEGVMKQITVPLLTILPLPYLQIDTVDISFTADVSVNSEGKMMAKVSNATDSEAVKQSSLNFQSQIGIDIKASSAGNMPVGIAKLLDILGNSCIEVVEVEEEKDEEEEEGEADATKDMPKDDKPTGGAAGVKEPKESSTTEDKSQTSSAETVKGNGAETNSTKQDKTVRVLALVTPEKVEEAKEAGADYVGMDEYISKIKEGWADFDVVIAMTNVMAKVGSVAKYLGPKGLMPNPKDGTVTSEVGRTVRMAKQGYMTELYNVVLDKKPTKSQLAKVVSTIVSSSGGIVTEESVMNAIQNSTNMTVLTSVKKGVAENVISEVESVGGKLRKIQVG